jgi:hypothetical protein
MMSAYLASFSLFVSGPLPVDAVRKSLESASSRWFQWLVISSIVVGIGVCFEWWEATITLKKWYRHLKGLPVPPDDEKSWAIPLSYLGLLLVVFGVMGEGIFEFLSANVETLLRSHDEQILGATESKFGQLKDSAEAATKAAGKAEDSATKADLSADDASVKSGEAVISAGNATTLAKDARREADSFEKDIASANTTATEAEKHLADALRETAKAEAELTSIRSPRSIINKSVLIAALTPFKGTEYTLNAFLDEESDQFSIIFAGVLKEAGWIRKQPAGINLGVPAMKLTFEQGIQEIVPSCVETGISLHAPTGESVSALAVISFESLPKTLQAALVLRNGIGPSISPADERNVVAGVVDTHPADRGSIVICVGKKP